MLTVYCALFAIIFLSDFINCKPVSVGLGKKHVTPSYRNYQRFAKVVNNNSSANIPVWGNVWPVAIYWTYIRVGSPLQNYPVAIDSGSMTLDIVGPDCTTCVNKPPNRAYQPTNSSTSVTLKCQDEACPSWCVPFLPCSFSNTYQTCDLSNPNAPCTIEGVWFQDMGTFGNLKPVPITFGAIQWQTSNFNQFQNINGVVGMIQTGSKPDPTQVFFSLFGAGSVKENIFAMCLLMNPGKLSNGTLTLGGIDHSLYTGNIMWTPNVGGEFYGMQMNALTVFGNQITSVASNAILDSGTNVLLLPDPGFTDIYNAFAASCARGPQLVGVCGVTFSNSLFNGNCFQMTKSQINAFPNITLNIANVNIVMNPSTYLNQFDPESPNPLLYCLGIRNTGTGGMTIIGDTSMSNYYVIFDNTQNRIGWANVSPKCGSQSV